MFDLAMILGAVGKIVGVWFVAMAAIVTIALTVTGVQVYKAWRESAGIFRHKPRRIELDGVPQRPAH